MQVLWFAHDRAGGLFSPVRLGRERRCVGSQEGVPGHVGSHTRQHSRVWKQIAGADDLQPLTAFIVPHRD